MSAQQVKAKMDSLRQQVEETENKLMVATESVEQYKAESRDHEKTIADNIRKLHLAEENVDRLESQNEALRAKLLKVEAALEESMHKTKSLDGQLSSLDEVDKVKSQLQELRTRLNEAEHKSEDLERKNRILTQELDKAELENSANIVQSIKVKLDEAERRAEDAERKSARLQGEVDKAESQLDTHRAEAGEAKNTSIAIEHLERKIRDLSLQLDKKDELITQVQKEKSTLQQEVDDMMSELS